MEYRWFKDGRMYVKSKDIKRSTVFGVTKEYFDEYIGDQDHFEGNLILSDANITSLGNLESVGGNLGLSYTKITSLGKLNRVSGNVFLNNLDITTLGKLERVGGAILLGGTNLKSLGKLDQVRRKIECTKNTSTHELLMNSKFRDKIVIL